MPSASPDFLLRLYRKIEWETAGVGVYAVPSESITSTLFAASTSSALANAGSDSA